MFTEPKARAAWRQFRFRTELMLSSVSRSVRRELLDDLAAHVCDLVAHRQNGSSELEGLESALARIGDPREFLAPLISDAIFRDPRRDVGLRQAGRAMLSLLSYGRRSVSALLAIFLAALSTLVAFGSLLHPEAVGLFRVGPDDIQLRLFGGQGGTPIFTPWFPLCLLALAAASAAFGWRQAQRLVRGILMNGMREDDH